MTQPVNIFLQGGAVSIEDLLGDASPTDATSLITIPSGTSLILDGGATSPTTYLGTITGAGSFVKQGSSSLTLSHASSNFTGPVEVANGTLQLGAGTTDGSVGTGNITIDAGTTLAYAELGSATLPLPISNAIGGLGNLTISGNNTNGAVVLSGANSYSGLLTISGGRFVPTTVGAIGNPSSIVVSNGGQFSFGALSGVNLTVPITLSTTGFTDGNGTTGALLFTGTNNTWSGQITATGTGTAAGRIGAFGATANLPGVITGAGTIDFGAGTATAEKFLVTGAANNVTNANVNPSASVIVGTGTTLGSLSNNINLVETGSGTGTLAYNTSLSQNFNGTITGNGALAIQGGGIMTFGAGSTVTVGTLGNNNTGLFVGDNIGGTAGTGTLNILAGAAVTDAAAFFDGAAAAAAGTVFQSGGSVTLTSTSGTGNNTNLRIEAAAGINQTSVYNLTGGTLTATSSELTVGWDGMGVLNISGPSAVAKLLGIRETSTNNFTVGTVNVTGSGTLQLGASGVYAGTAVGNQVLKVNGGTVQPFAANTISVPTEITGVANFDTHTVTGTLTQTFAEVVTGTVGGTGSILKLGAGTLTLAGNNPYTGGTKINAGTLTSKTSSSLGSGTVTEAGGTLNVTGNNTLTNAGLPSVTGFGGTGSGWTLNAVTASVGATIASNDLTITQPIATSAANSVWFASKVSAVAFTSSFSYVEASGTGGFSIAWQNAAGGTAAIGANGGNEGYGGGATLVGSSFAVVFEPTGIAFSENGTVGTVLPLGNGVSLATVNTPTNISLAYDGAVMSVTLTQGANSFTTSFGVNLAVLLGSNIATVGFTGGTGGASKQDITNFVYNSTTTTPSVGIYPNAVTVAPGATASTNVTPTTVTSSVTMAGTLTAGAGSTLNVTGNVIGFGVNGSGWNALGGATVTNDALALTTAATNESRQLWYLTPVNESSFHANYNYTAVAGGANGSAFVLQESSAGTAATGTNGAGLGYGGITPSFAVEFNILAANTVGYRFAADGTTGAPYTAINSTNGTVTGNPINLVSGSPINVDLNYNGTTLTMTLTDSAGDTYVTTDPVNIPSILGINTAIMGFTGGTGATDQAQTIDSFSYAGGAPTYALTFGSPGNPTNLTGTDTINVTTGGTLTLGSLNDAGVPATLNLNTVGSGTVNLAVPATSLVLGSAVNLGGTLGGGILDVSNGSLGSLAAVTVASGASIVLGDSETLGSLAGGGNVTLNGNILTVGANNLSSTFAGAIADGSNPNQVIKVGTGSLTLTGTNNYTSPTTVSAGSLIVNSPGSITASTVSVVGTGILGGNGTVDNVTNSGIINPGSPGAPGTLNVAGNLTLAPGTLVLDLAAAVSDSINVTNIASNVNITGSTLSLNVSTITPGESFTILSLPMGDSVSGFFNGLLGNGTSFTVGSLTFTINYNVTGSGDGTVDTVLTASGVVPTLVNGSPTLNGNGGGWVNVTTAGVTTNSFVPGYIENPSASKQHSMVESVVYSFAQGASLSTTNFSLTGFNGTTTAPNVVLTPSSDNTVWTVTFAGTGVNTVTHSIGDGEYQLILSGLPGLTNNTYDFYRLLGDIDGSGGVDSGDLLTLNGTFLRSPTDPGYLGAMDFDGSNTVDSADLLQFDSNFLHTVPKMSNGLLPN